MNIRTAWLFYAVVAVVAAALLYVGYGGARAPAEDARAASGSEAPVAHTGTTAAPAPTAAAADAQAQPAAATPDAEMRVAPIASDAERELTRAQRSNALPVFLKTADESIATLQADIARAVDAGVDEDEIAAMQARLATMQRVREEVLARNADVRG